MKKLISLFLVLAILFSLTACGGEVQTGDNGTDEKVSNDGSSGSTDYAKTVFAADMAYATGGGVSAVNDLSNTYYKLTKEKKLKVGYIGGSVTDGTGGTDGYCWAAGVTDWFTKEYPDAEITYTNNAWGNKSSLWGFYRADGDTDWGHSSHGATLVEAKPDLVFLEFAINDLYVRMSDFTTIHYVEGIINKIRKALPDTDIVLILITDEDNLGKELKTAGAQCRLAAHYGIPVIDIGPEMNEYIKSTGTPFRKLYMDNVHPNNAGYKVYADIITKHLKDILSKAKATGVKACEMPKNSLVSGSVSESYIITAEELAKITDVSDWTVMESPSNQVKFFGPSLYGLDGAKLSFDIEGTGICLMVDGKQGSVVKCTIDGKETVTASVLNDIHTEMLLANNLTPGKHKIELTIASGRRFIIGAVMVEK